MHYRITKVHHEPGKRDDSVAYLKTKDEDVMSIEGLQSVRMIALSETESIAISKYENEQQLKMYGHIHTYPFRSLGMGQGWGMSI